MTLVLAMGLAFVTAALVLSTWGGAAFVAGRRNGTLGYLREATPALAIRTAVARVEPLNTGPLSALISRVTPAGRRGRFAALADRAGAPQLAEVAMKTQVAGLVSAVLLLLFTSPLLGVAGIVGAWLGPELWLRSKAETRGTAIRRALPDFLDLLAISVEAGAGLDNAMARAANEVGGPLGEEFHRLLHSLGLGSSRREAFVTLKERAQVRELSSFVLALLQAEALGISLAGVLRTQATEMRSLRRRLAREQAAKAPVKILFPLVFGIFPALMLVVLGPAAIRIMQTLVFS